MKSVVDPNVFNILFPNVGLVAIQSGVPVKQKIKLEEIEVIGFPLGTAVLKFIINWKPNDDVFTLDELRAWVYLSKFRHKVDYLMVGFLIYLLNKVNSNQYIVNVLDHEFYHHFIKNNLFLSLLLVTGY